MVAAKLKTKSINNLIFFIVLLLLAFTNPSEEDYYDWYVGRPDGKIETSGAELLAKPLIEGMTIRNNLWFSPYLQLLHSEKR